MVLPTDGNLGKTSDRDEEWAEIELEKLAKKDLDVNINVNLLHLMKH